MCLLSQRVLKILNAILLAILIQFCTIEIFVDIDNVMYQSQDTTLLILSCAFTTLLFIFVSCLGFFVLFKGQEFQLRLLLIGIFIFFIVKCVLWIIFWIMKNKANIVTHQPPWLEITLCWTIICMIGIVQLLMKQKREQENLNST